MQEGLRRIKRKDKSKTLAVFIIFVGNYLAMTVSATQENLSISNTPARQISWAEFQKKYLSREDRYKYEWVDGQVEKTPRTMDKSQFYIQNNLINFLYRLKSTGKTGGQLIAEGDTFFGANHRRPDIAFYSDEQIKKGAKGENIIPQFVIEVISGKDQMNLVHKKMQDYRKAKVAVVWHVFPDLAEVHVYRGRKMEVCQANDLCSAEPVIPGFRISVAELLRK